jgi:hypothetical protein
MADSVIFDVVADPPGIGLFRAEAIIPFPEFGSDLVEEFRF